MNKPVHIDPTSPSLLYNPEAEMQLNKVIHCVPMYI